MIIIPFKSEHLVGFDAQANQVDYISRYQVEQGKALETSGVAKTAIEGDYVIGCAGIIKFHENRAQAWMVLSRNAGRHIWPIFQEIKKFLDEAPYKRIEAVCTYSFYNGHRLLQMLGFKPEALMKYYDEAGNDCSQYVRIK
jgi:hypothetical protein